MGLRFETFLRDRHWLRTASASGTKLKALLTKVGGAFFVSSDFGNYEVRGTNFDGLRWRAVF